MRTRMVVSGNKRPATDRSTSTSTTSDNDDDDPSDGGESATTTAMSTTTTTNTTTDKTTSTSILARKREMARLRQRKYVARKRQREDDQVLHEGSNENQQSKKRRQCHPVAWQARYGELVEFRNNFGHTNVQSHETKLGRWAKAQRSQYKNNTLKQERINRLNALSFVWDLLEEKKRKRDAIDARKVVERAEKKKATDAKRMKKQQETRKRKQAEQETCKRKQAEQEQVKRIFNLPKDKRTPEEKKFLADNPFRIIDKTPLQRLKTGFRQIHTEVMYGCQFAIDRKKKEGKGGCNSNPLTGSTIEKTGEVDKDGKLVWKRIDARLEFHNNANIRNTGLQFTGGGNGSAYITRTVDGVSIVWPEFNNTITVQAIQELGKSLMNHLSITDHNVVGKLLEMRHWHSMNYFGHRPVGIYWFHKDGGTLSSMTNNQMESVASKGAQWIQNTFTNK